MFLTRLQRCITAWVAMFALVLGALAPTLVQAAVAGSDRGDWLEVCSVSGMVWVKADTGEVRSQAPDGSAPADMAGQHCPWCSLHGGTAGLPENPTALRLDALPAERLVPTLAERATDTPWAKARSRAPPLAT